MHMTPNETTDLRPMLDYTERELENLRRIANGIKDTPARQIARQRLARLDAELREAGRYGESKPFVGQAATVHLWTDTQAAVVVRVNAKSVVVALVETDPATKRVTNPGEPYPCVVEDGDLTKIIPNSESRATIVETDHGTSYRVGGRRGSIRVSLGVSIDRTDYRY